MSVSAEPTDREWLYVRHKTAKKRLCRVLCVKQQQKDSGNIRIPKNGDETPYLSRTYTRIPELSRYTARKGKKGDQESVCLQTAYQS